MSFEARNDAREPDAGVFDVAAPPPFAPAITTYQKATPPTGGAQYGFNVDITPDGNTIATSAIEEGAGAVHILTRAGNGWASGISLGPPTPSPLDLFGYSLGISADAQVLVAGAPQEDGIGDATTSRGAAWVFRQSSGTWAPEAYLQASNGEPIDFFGWNVDISSDGSTIAVSALFEDSAATGVDGDQGDNSHVNSGAVYVFRHAGGGSWPQDAYLKPALPAAAGDRVALSGDGNVLAYGAAGDPGYVFIYERRGGTWDVTATLQSGNANASFGNSLSFSGDGRLLAVGAPLTTVGTIAEAGAAYVFENTGTWTERARVVASNPDPGDRFGQIVKLSNDGSVVAVASFYEDGAIAGVNGDMTNNGAMDSGAVYLFGGPGWPQLAYIKAPNPDAQDFFGSVAISTAADVVVVGAAQEDSAGATNDNSLPGSGAIYIYD